MRNVVFTSKPGIVTILKYTFTKMALSFVFLKYRTIKLHIEV